MDNNEWSGRREESQQSLSTYSQEQLRQTRPINRIQRARVRMLPQQTGEEEEEILAEGEIILDGRYRIVQLLYKRPRLHLYLARRLSPEVSSEEELAQGEREPLVAIRELVLTSFPPPVREQIEKAAFEEFVSPIVQGPSQHSTGGDRVWTEGERHYLVTQLYDRKSAPYADVITLAELVLDHREWPTWLNEEIALSWGARLCRIVARLHRLGIVLGDLDLSTILVSSSGESSWAPILLASWPPPLQFWPPGTTAFDVSQQYRQVFPTAGAARWNAFIAPEMLNGNCDERSDVYTLGAILYLLLTHYAPVAAIHRLQAVPEVKLSEEDGSVTDASVKNNVTRGTNEGLELILPRLLYREIPEALEQILLRALELDPDLRYLSVFALVEALEAAELEAVTRAKAHSQESGGRKLLMRRVKC
ncbi:MAG: hypothetical protein JO011_18140 [Ktedonobacteraceae bacterium]|nr:hypothetical protein [Ktedonobacteraceae bacterium]